MATSQPVDEVAEDFRGSLQYLTDNDRYAISNFTVIAKESTEHADAISNVLIEHIGKAPPTHKLPALYVLDSIAKNIGTPYTLFLGHRLYNTFMSAYSLVDQKTRKKLDEMLITWKSPVPGSIDSRPVFPNEITKKIENALLQAKTRALQNEQQQMRSQQELLRRRAPGTTPTTQWRSTPTPPQNTPRYPPPVSQGYVQPLAPNGNTHSPYLSYQQFPHQQGIPSYQTPPPTNAYSTLIPPQQSQNIELLHRDIEGLIRATQDEFAISPYDAGVQTRLKALLDLQSILRSQQLPPDQIQAVRNQVNVMQAAQAAPRPITIPIITPTPPVSMPYAPPVQLPYQSSTPSQAPPPVPSTNYLAGLLASVERSKSLQTGNPYTPPPVTSAPLVPHIPAVPEENPLIARLRASGLLGGAGTPPISGTPAQASGQAPPNHPIGGSLNLSDLLRGAIPVKKNEIDLTAPSLKQPRPHLLAKLYEARPNQCQSCGKRFLASDEGKKEKARHLDWHFRTNQRLTEAAQRGQSRSWYVGELEWIKSRDNEEGSDGAANGSTDDGTAADENDKNSPESQFIPVPTDSALANIPCPICQEKFETSWNEKEQDFVWMDAKAVKGRIYHVSCYDALEKDGANASAARTATPDSVLGKRKAEAASNPSPAKTRKESSD